MNSKRWGRFPVTVVILAILYILLDFVLIPANRMVLHPLHRDDYTSLARSIETLEPRSPRPVSTFAIALLATAGPHAYDLALNVLMILYPALVFLFLARLFGRNPSLPAICVASLILLSFPNSVEWAKYTGLITNLLSGIFGVLALLCIHSALASQQRKNWSLAAGIAWYALSIFSKEDFALPAVILLVFYLARKNGRAWHGALALGAVATSLMALFLYNSRIPYSFAKLTSSGPYEARFSPISVVSTFFRYLTLTPFLVGVLIILILTLVTAWTVARESRHAILLAVLMTGSLVVPYAVLPSHLAFYYPYGWLAWEAGLIGICLTLLADRVRRPALLYSAFAGLALLGAWRTQTERKAIVEWYRRESDRNEQIVHALIANREALSKMTRVGIIGIEGLSPWSHSSGEYLRTRLQFRNDWIVFVPRPVRSTRPMSPDLGVRTGGYPSVLCPRSLDGRSFLC